MKIKSFWHENSCQSTHHTVNITLSTWRISKLLFNDINTDRTGVIDEIRSSGSESSVFAAFLLTFIKTIILQFPQVRVFRWWCDWYLVLIIITVQKYNKEMYSYHWKRCLIKMTEAASGLMSIYIHFWRKLWEFQLGTTSSEKSLFLMIVTVQIYII